MSGGPGCERSAGEVPVLAPVGGLVLPLTEVADPVLAAEGEEVAAGQPVTAGEALLTWRPDPGEGR